LRKQGQVIPLAERQFKLLLLLASASPASLSKKQLAEAIWDDVVVSDWSLFRLISDTRQLLGDDGEAQQIIKTSRGIGFCIAPVQHCETMDSADSLSIHAFKVSKPRPWLIAAVLSVLCMVILIGWQLLAQRELHAALSRVALFQDNTYTAFKAQLARRNELATMLESRLNIERQQQFEKFFAQYYPQMTQQELFVFQQIRGITESGLYKNNQAILDELDSHPAILQEIGKAKALQQHLNFWVNKYHSVFLQREDMCLLYVGVEDGVPYPSGVDKEVQAWLKAYNE
jgi:DNA-binding winged helix-turn-helix (wHTH) protein